MVLAIVVFGAVGGLTGDIKTDGGIGNDSGRCEAAFEGEGVVDGFDGRAGLARAKSDVYLAVVLAVEVVARTDHSENFSGLGVGD